MNKNFKKLKKFNCLKQSLDNEKYSIYAPSIIRSKKKYFMFYSAWKSKKSGNINCAYSRDGFNWKKFKKNIFNYKQPIKIVSEPFVFKNRNDIFIFFEYKNKSKWNIGSKKISKNFFITREKIRLL